MRIKTDPKIIMVYFLYSWIIGMFGQALRTALTTRFPDLELMAELEVLVVIAAAFLLRPVKVFRKHAKAVGDAVKIWPVGAFVLFLGYQFTNAALNWLMAQIPEAPVAPTVYIALLWPVVFVALLLLTFWIDGKLLSVCAEQMRRTEQSEVS